MFVLDAEGTAVILSGITLVATVYPLLEELLFARELLYDSNKHCSYTNYYNDWDLYI